MSTQIKPAGMLAVLLLTAAIVLTMIQGRQDSNSLMHPDEAASTVPTRSADRAASDPERERRRKESISLAAQKWYEELLEKYPRMKPVYRDVPDENNGYLQLLLLVESVEKPRLPADLQSMLSGDGTVWEGGKFKAWLSENQTYFDQILRVAELPDRSTKGIAFDRVYNGAAQLKSEFSWILQASARLAFESGDQESALRYMKASGCLGDHLADIEVPSMLGEVISTGIRAHARDSFRENFLPTLANDPEALRRWNEVIFRIEKPAREYSRAITGEWNTSIRYLLLPALLGDHSVVDKVMPIDDVTELIDSYTLSMQKSADGISQMGADRFDVTQAMLAFPKSANDGDSGKVTAGSMLFSIRGLAQGFGRQATDSAMNSAAVSILLGEEPPADPVSGKPFIWDPTTRLLTAPEGEDEPESIKVPASTIAAAPR